MTCTECSPAPSFEQRFLEVARRHVQDGAKHAHAQFHLAFGSLRWIRSRSAFDCLVDPKHCYDPPVFNVSPVPATMIVNAFARAGHISAAQAQAFTASGASLVAMAPGLLNMAAASFKLSADKIIDIVDQATTASGFVRQPVPGSENDWWERCRERPLDPICLVGATRFADPGRRAVTADFVTAWRMFEEGIITAETTSTFFASYHREITAGHAVTDIEIDTARAIVSVYVEDSAQGARIDESLTASWAGQFGPDDVPQECMEVPPPAWCTRAGSAPLAATLVSEFVKAQIITSEPAQVMRAVFGAGPLPSPAQRAARSRG